MKKVLKVILLVVIILIVILLINSIRNIYIITKTINLSFDNIYNSNKIVNLTTSLNGEISSAKQMAKDTGYRIKDEIPKMNAYVTYEYFDEK